uniref:Uncharacterized protein n=1 Tax=Takifugu rubripes TaxID=31033 RepID=A0A674MNQ0_TAKRU
MLTAVCTIWHKQAASMDPSCLVSTVQAAAGIKVWGRLSRPTLGPLVPTEHGLSSAAYLSIDADHFHPFMTPVDQLLMAASSRMMHHDTKRRSPQTGFWNMAMSSFNPKKACTIIRSQSNRASLRCGGTEIPIIDVQSTNPQQL